MSINIDLLGMIYIFGALQGFLLSILLFIKHRHSRANQILAWLILLYSVFVIRIYLFEQQAWSLEHPYLLMIFDGLPLLFAPLHLMYVGLLTDTHRSFAKPNWMHFIPFLLYRLYYLQVFIIPKEELLKIFLQLDEGVVIPHIYISTMIISLLGLFYMAIALITFREYTCKIKFTFSSIERINLPWLRFFTLLAAAVWLVASIENVYILLNKNVELLTAGVPFLTSVYIYAIGYIGMFKTEIFTQSSIIENIHDAQYFSQKITLSSKEQKYRKSGLTREKADDSLQIIKKAMEDEKMFTDSEITLSDFSRKVGIPSHHISEVINTRLNQNFFDFVNYYRIEKVKEDLLDASKSHLTILGIAMDAGFNSKSGFNAIFKRMTGQTPSEFRNQT